MFIAVLGIGTWGLVVLGGILYMVYEEEGK